MNAQVKLSPKCLYEVSVNGQSLGDFTQVSEWNGMRELKSEKHGTLIVAIDQSLLSALAKLVEEYASVIKASPDLCLVLQEENQKPTTYRDCNPVLSLEDAKNERRCRICGGRETAQMTYNFGREFSHTACYRKFFPKCE